MRSECRNALQMLTKSPDQTIHTATSSDLHARGIQAKDLSIVQAEFKSNVSFE